MNIGVHVFFNLWFSQGVDPVVGLLGHMVDLFLVFGFFKEISILFSVKAVSVYIPTNFPFLHILSSIDWL